MLPPIGDLERIWPLVTAFGLHGPVCDRQGHLRGRPAALRRGAERAGARGTPFIIHNIGHAGALRFERVEARLSGDGADGATPRNAVTLRNVPLWDPQPLKDTFSQISRTYYDFVSVDNDRYLINGSTPDHAVTREAELGRCPEPQLDQQALPTFAGYGLTLGPVSR